MSKIPRIYHETVQGLNWVREEVYGVISNGHKSIFVEAKAIIYTWKSFDYLLTHIFMYVCIRAWMHGMKCYASTFPCNMTHTMVTSIA